MASKISSEDLAKRYKKAVEDQLGLIAKKDEVDDVVFKHPDLGNFYFSLDAENDPEYLMLVFPNFMDKDATGGDRLKLLEAVNRVNGKSKCAKLSVRPGEEANVIATVECIVAAPNEMPSEEFLNATIQRMFSTISACVKALVAEVRPPESGSENSSV
jgi:hypothetical protein